MLYARYNKDTNNMIINLLSKFSNNDLHKERNMYYKSINNLFNHLVTGQWYYLHAMKSFLGMSFPNEQKRHKTFNKIEESFKEASLIMKEMDEDFIEVINIMSEKELEIGRKNIRIYNGRIVDISLWEYITQHIIHQTHHRGQLAQLLDELEIENDFGNIFPFVKDCELHRL